MHKDFVTDDADMGALLVFVSLICATGYAAISFVVSYVLFPIFSIMEVHMEYVSFLLCMAGICLFTAGVLWRVAGKGSAL